MKKVFKIILLISFFIIGCNVDNDLNDVVKYPYMQQVGYSANDILSNDSFGNIYFEVMHVDGFAPSDKTLNNLKIFIEDRTYKSNIIVEKRLINIPLKPSYTLDEIKIIEEQNRSKFSGENQIVISILFLNGVSSANSENSVVLGTAYRNSSLVIFEESIHFFSDDPFEPKRNILETKVILHEFCHLLGLVNKGTSTVNNHQDSEHMGHCIIEDCLMYYLVIDGSIILDLMNTDKIPQLDSFCMEDLKSNGGK